MPMEVYPGSRRTRKGLYQPFESVHRLMTPKIYTIFSDKEDKPIKMYNRELLACFNSREDAEKALEQLGEGYSIKAMKLTEMMRAQGESLKVIDGGCSTDTC